MRQLVATSSKRPARHDHAQQRSARAGRALRTSRRAAAAAAAAAESRTAQYTGARLIPPLEVWRTVLPTDSAVLPHRHHGRRDSLQIGRADLFAKISRGKNHGARLIPAVWLTLGPARCAAATPAIWRQRTDPRCASFGVMCRADRFRLVATKLPHTCCRFNRRLRLIAWAIEKRALSDIRT